MAQATPVTRVKINRCIAYVESLVTLHSSLSAAALAAWARHHAPYSRAEANNERETANRYRAALERLCCVMTEAEAADAAARESERRAWANVVAIADGYAPPYPSEY